MMFNSVFKEKLSNFLEYKNNNGFYKKSIIEKLKNFDKYILSNNITTDILTKDIVISYIESHINVKKSTLNNYASVMRQFGTYLNALEGNSYILPLKYYPDEDNFIPYIFTKEEERKIYMAIKESNYKHNPKKQEQIKLIFMLLFSTGMRIGEILNIKRENIDYKKHTIYITDTKNNCDRIIVVSNKLSDTLKEFENKYNKDYIFFFENGIGKKYTVGCFYAIFRSILFKAKIMHSSKGPRVHDIRHTFAVNSFRQAINNGKNIENYLPILSTYMGHKDIISTYKYLHLTKEFFPNIRQKVENIIELERNIAYEEF